MSSCKVWLNFSVSILYIRLPLSNSPFGNHRVQVKLFLARSCLSYPAGNTLYRCCVKTVLKVIAPRWKMRNPLVQRISNKPPTRRHTISRPSYQRLCNKILTFFDIICNNFLCYYHVVCNKILAFQDMVCSSQEESTECPQNINPRIAWSECSPPNKTYVPAYHKANNSLLYNQYRI